MNSTSETLQNFQSSFAALHTAHEMFTEMGAEAFAERARRELAATGEKTQKRAEPTLLKLTTREAQVARLASDGLSNIDARPFVSRRTVEYHLGNVFAKLSVTSRHELNRVITNPSAMD